MHITHHNTHSQITISHTCPSRCNTHTHTNTNTNTHTHSSHSRQIAQCSQRSRDAATQLVAMQIKRPVQMYTNTHVTAAPHHIAPSHTHYTHMRPHPTHALQTYIHDGPTEGAPHTSTLTNLQGIHTIAVASPLQNKRMSHHAHTQTTAQKIAPSNMETHACM